MVVWMAGGLGNQMFMYAFGKALQKSLNEANLNSNLNLQANLNSVNLSQNLAKNAQNFTASSQENPRDFRGDLNLNLSSKLALNSQISASQNPNLSPNGDLVFDTSSFKIDKAHYERAGQGFDIRHFNVDLSGFDEDFDKEDFFKTHDKFYAKFYSKNQLKRKYLRHFIRRYSKPTYSHFVRDAECTVFDLINAKFHPQSYFFGYWQSLSYFSHFEKELRGEFTLKSPLNQANSTLERQILSTPNSVFLHVRRGDFPQHWRVVGGAYYESAINYIKQKLEKPYIFIFSDEIEWCEREFLALLSDEAKRGVEFHFVKNDNRQNATQEMQLMRGI